MTESSEDKTCRKMVSLLNDNKWRYQYSIFRNVRDLEYEEAKKEALDWVNHFDFEKFRDYLARKNKNTAILFIFRKHQLKGGYRTDGKSIIQFYVTLYCNQELDIDWIPDGGGFNIVSKSVSKFKINSTCNALRKQSLHDLSLLGSRKRYSILNKKMLINVNT